MFWNIDGAAKHIFIATVNCVTIFFGLISNLHYRTLLWITSLFTPWRIKYDDDDGDVKCKAQMKSGKGGNKFFAPELGPPYFQFASYAYEFTTFVRL